MKYGCPECKHLACVCNVLERHHDLCKFRQAVTCAVAIECEHGYDVCPECDPCDCGIGIATEDFADKEI